MQEIFISYRHGDTSHWAAALMRDLLRSFGRNSVFMDQRDESLPLGSRWSAEIERAASRCEAMLVLIGAQWIDCRGPDGRRRLEDPDDWVRREVLLGLDHDALVLPLVFEGGRAPTAAELPPELLPMLGTQFNTVPITDQSWEPDIVRLIDALIGRQVLRNLHDFCTARTGIARLRELIDARADVRLAVARSREAVQRAADQIRTLRLLKDVHDALHAIEHHCLEPIRLAPVDADLALYEIDLADPAAQIQAAAATLGADLPTLLVFDRRLEAIAGQLHRLRTPADHRLLVAELEGLISRAPDVVDGLIKTAATALNIGGLVELLGTVQQVLADRADADPELAPLLGLARAIEGLHQHLVLLVREHGQLQALDLTLRFVCRGSLAPESADGSQNGPDIELLRLEWQQVDLQRLALAPPHSQELLRSRLDVLQVIEDRLRGALAAGDATAAWSNFQAYFEAVGKVFWTLDSRLKAFCNELDDAANPLRAILAQLEGGP